MTSGMYCAFSVPKQQMVVRTMAKKRIRFFMVFSFRWVRGIGSSRPADMQSFIVVMRVKSFNHGTGVPYMTVDLVSVGTAL